MPIRNHCFCVTAEIWKNNKIVNYSFILVGVFSLGTLYCALCVLSIMASTEDSSGSESAQNSDSENPLDDPLAVTLLSGTPEPVHRRCLPASMCTRDLTTWDMVKKAFSNANSWWRLSLPVEMMEPLSVLQVTLEQHTCWRTIHLKHQSFLVFVWRNRICWIAKPSSKRCKLSKTNGEFYPMCEWYIWPGYTFRHLWRRLRYQGTALVGSDV